jgi:CheY-like chemotaxis protein
MQESGAMKQKTACVHCPEVQRPHPSPTESPTDLPRTILLVDDEAIIRDMATDLFQRMGYTVYTASDGFAALERFQELQGEVGVVLLDFAMPRMGGLECLKRLQELKPDIRVLFSSGYDLAHELQDQQIPGTWSFIQKPYRISELEEAIQTILEN